MEEGSERYNKVFPKGKKKGQCLFEAFLQKRHAKRSRFRGGKGGNGEIFIQFSDFSGTLFFFFVVCSNSKKKKISSRERERGLECSNYDGKDVT